MSNQQTNAHKREQLIDLEAFCAICIPPDKVTNLLQTSGFTLTFQMDEIIPPRFSQTPALPAQYHYGDQYGTEVIYLAGHDVDTDGRQLPDHASRFWLFPGSDLAAYRQVASLLAVRWRFSWRRSDSTGSCKEIA